MLDLLLFFFLALILPHSAHASTCSSVEALGSIEVTYSLNLAYIQEQTQYWSTSCSALRPSCILFPKTVEEVSTIVKILANSSEPFAVKSGGHNPNNGWSSVAGGPLIAMERFDQANLDRSTGVVDVGPGNRLDGISAKLQGTGWTFVGGRIGNTGVGGLVLGGGLSYMSTQYGWAASSVLEYEIVFANGTIGHINGENHPNIFRALKGGGNNFGIVTNYKLQAHRQGNIWGGNLVYLRTPEKDKQLLQAVRDWTEYNEDEKAAVIVTAERANINVVDSWIIFLFYDGPSPPPGLFKNFTDANPLLDTTRTQTYADLMATSNWVVIKGSVVDIATETIPLPSAENQVKVMEGLHNHWRNISSTTLLVPGIVASIAWQPFPKKIAQKARELSPDLIDADADVDRIIIEMNYAFIPQSEYEPMANTMEATYSGVRNRVTAWQADGTLPQAYLPIFMNYGFYRQDYFGRLRPESRALAKRVSEQVDPAGLFKSRTGGWKP
ncbi:FAD-binding domain-containing protein [Cucurbitaria berberidis CBS 394.84]|uniref:FAD-binding domain-containing protein n=1 Tax=Cucurbitaria berberidis CBS 394.84 TaxID=1168544 RepID=A0A9P4L3S3_9PLEO|nr:FAD-binding domain-containing protein [Cucurbitaria berberidis CBS 394.84]KAF1840695.1 FAD-binding domain-containing protein [Cucurbitaria berberidis CBS 394.84]